MHAVDSASPRPELKAYVRAFAQRSMGHDHDFAIVEPVPASLDPVMNFEFGVAPIGELVDVGRFTVNRVSIIGYSAYRPFNMHLSAGVESFAIFFQPLAFWQLFRLPIRDFANHHYDGYAVLGSEGRQLWNRLAEASAFRERIKVAEAYLLRKAMNAQRNTSLMNAAVYMFQRQGAVKLDEVAGHLSCGLRQFERNFLRDIGLSPKLYTRVARFQAALDTRIHRQGTRWANLANDFGYHDQMHMIKEFQKLSGLTPERLLSQIGDMRPPALFTAVREGKRLG